MTFKEFLEKYPEGTKVDFDGLYGAQCVDLFRRYLKDVWGIESYGKDGIGGINGAKDLWLGNINNLDKYLDKLPLEQATEGDIIIFNATANNKFGHVAIFVSLETNGTIRVFEQDGFKQTGTKYAFWKKDTVLGILRKKA